MHECMRTSIYIQTLYIFIEGCLLRVINEKVSNEFYSFKFVEIPERYNYSDLLNIHFRINFKFMQSVPISIIICLSLSFSLLSFKSLALFIILPSSVELT